jgi:hypothetical protein
MSATLLAKSIRPFIGSKNYTLSREFYLDLGFEEFIISKNMSSFQTGEFAFYLQDYYAKDWIENSMVFLEVSSPKQLLEELKKLELPKKYKNVKLSEIRHNDWGNEFFLHDPSGILWHFGAFNS